MLIAAAQFLTYAEAVALYHTLQELEVDALVKTCGPPTFPFGEGMYYQLLIEEADVPLAQDVVAFFEQQRSHSQPMRCPRCKATEIELVTRPKWWQRLYYAGTRLHKCRNCGAEFSV